MAQYSREAETHCKGQWRENEKARRRWRTYGQSSPGKSDISAGEKRQGSYVIN